MSKIDLDFASVELISPDIIKTIYKDGVRITLENVILVDQAYQELAVERPVFSILDARNIRIDMENDAQNFLANEGLMSSQIGAAALLLNSLPARLLARFFINHKNPKYPTKIFSKEEKAIEWFKTIKSAQK